MKLIQRLQATRDRVYGIGQRLGAVGHVECVIFDRVSKHPHKVAPDPLLKPPSPNKLYMFEKANVEVLSTDRMLTGVSRTGLEDKVKIGITCQIASKVFTILWIDDSKPLEYQMLVREERNR